MAEQLVSNVHIIIGRNLFNNLTFIMILITVITLCALQR